MFQLIVDTSIWIDFFNGTLPLSHKDALITFIGAEQVVLTDIIRHELLVGAKNDNDYRRLQQMLSALSELMVSPEQSARLNWFGYELRKQGITSKYTDLTIAFLAKENALSVFSSDHYFLTLARRRIISILNP